MKQQTLAMANGFERYTKKTRRTLFLEEMEQVVPWAELCGLVEPVYAEAGNGRPPVGGAGAVLNSGSGSSRYAIADWTRTRTGCL